MAPVFVIFGLLAIGVVGLICGTIAKNRWGINLESVSCPRCNTLFPQIRQPQNVRQALWGGGTCAKCGTEVDKWGREMTSRERRCPVGGLKGEDQMRSLLKRRLAVYSAGVFFLLSLLFAWLGMRSVTGKVMWGPCRLWTSVLGVAIVETVAFTALFYSASIYLLESFVPRGHRRTRS
jgi:hypothetical protein